MNHDAISSFDGAMDMDMDMDNGDDDEDEEALELRLAEIQVKRKLRKLQKAREQGNQSPQKAPAGLTRSATTPNLRRANSVAANQASNIAGLREERLERNRSQASVHVPVSPIKRAAPPPDAQRSPSRILMGIDKQIPAAAVSLRRPPVRKTQDELMDNVRRAGSYLHRTNSSTASQDPFLAPPSAAPTIARPTTSFSDRMAKIRDEEIAQREKAERLRRARSKGFDINQNQIDTLRKAAAVPLPGSFDESDFRDHLPNRSRRLGSGHLIRNHSTSGSDIKTNSPDPLSTPTGPPSPVRENPLGRSRGSSISSTPCSQTGTEFDSFSSTHLSKRTIPHTTLTRTLTGKKVLKIPDLLAKVKAPDWEIPDVTGDVVVMAILANKSEPKAQKNGLNPGSKFMILTLTDLKWEMDLYLFGSGFSKYWKLTPGNVIAILNPTIMKPHKSDTGRFSLVINSDDDTILEVGSARDLGYCKSIKKDGSQCDSWIDKRHTEFCEFHINEALRKTKSGRMEVNTMDFGRKNRQNEAGDQWRSKDITGYKGLAQKNRKARLEKEGGKKYDWETGSHVYVHKGQAHFDNEVAEQFNKQERTRTRFAEEEKERELARKLGSLGGGLGAEYMTKKAGALTSSSQPLERDMFWNPPPKPDAKALGLLDGKASEVSLAPAKRKRTATMSGSNNSARGWGSDLSKDLGRMRDGQRLEPPVKKKTRFVTAKGIREAGRESFGGEPLKMVTLDDDDDDDLDIIP